MNEELLSTDQAAQDLGISRTRLYDLRRDKKIRAVQIGNMWVYPRSAIEERKAAVQCWIDALPRLTDTPSEAE